MVEYTLHGIVMRKADRARLLKHVQCERSEVYRGTIRLETPVTVHLCPDTAEMLGRELFRLAAQVRAMERSNVKPDPKPPTDRSDDVSPS